MKQLNSLPRLVMLPRGWNPYLRTAKHNFQVQWPYAHVSYNTPVGDFSVFLLSLFFFYHFGFGIAQ